eukprot:SAG31_NODE_13549_length_862_cov_1.019659_1_plen_47_part_10
MADLMKDPVSTAVGSTYDRSSITKWFSTGRTTDPLTNQRLLSTTLVP